MRMLPDEVRLKPIVLIIILIHGLKAVHSIKCKKILDMPLDTTLSFQELRSMGPTELIECLPHIAREPIRMVEADYIWQTIVEFYEGVPNVPQNVLAELHWVTPAVRLDDYGNLTLDSIDVVRNFGLNYGLDLTQLGVIADKVRTDFAGKTPEDYTYYDLKALNHILCAFNRSEIERIHPSAYKEAARFIGKLNNCNTEAMYGFATLAEHRDAFGPSQNWTGLILKIVGHIAEYLPGGITKELEKKIKTDKEKTDESEELAKDY